MELNLTKLAQAAQDMPAGVPEDELVGRERAFEVRYKDPESLQLLTATFVGKVGDKESKVLAGRIMSDLAGTSRFSDMPDGWQEWAEAVAVCATRLVSKPAWFDDKGPSDDALLFAVYGRLLEHERLYFRSATLESDPTAGLSRVDIRAAAIPEAGSGRVARQSNRART